MADITLQAAPILGGVSVETSGCRLTERADLALVSLAVPNRGLTKLTKALKSGFGLPMPKPTRSAEKDGFRLVQTAPDQMLLIFSDASPDPEPAIQAKLSGTAYTTNQTDAWVRLDLSGQNAVRALERLCPLDLHDSVFPVGAAARTVMEHMGAILVRTAPDSFLLLSASSSGASFMHALETSLHYIDA